MECSLDIVVIQQQADVTDPQVLESLPSLLPWVIGQEVGKGLGLPQTPPGPQQPFLEGSMDHQSLDHDVLVHDKVYGACLKESGDDPLDLLESSQRSRMPLATSSNVRRVTTCQ